MTVDYSIVIPAYNEESELPATLASVHAAMTQQTALGEVVVVDNNSTDRTAAVAEEQGARVFFEPFNQISRARNTGARAARGRYLIFLDADTRLPAPLLREALDRLRSGRHAGGGAMVVFDRPMGRIGRGMLAGWGRLSRWNSWAAGSFIFCRREAFEAVGGFSEAVYASEEIWLSRALRRWGKARGLRFSIVPEPPVVTSSRKMDWYSGRRMLALLVLHILCPWSVRSRRWCRFWYDRPGSTPIS